MPSIPRIKSENPLEGLSVSSHQPPPALGASSLNAPVPTDPVAGTSGKANVTLPSAGTGSSSKTGKQVVLGNKKPNTFKQSRVSSTSESRRRSSSRRDGAGKQSTVGENDSIRSEKLSAEKRHRRSIRPSSPEQQQMNRVAAASSITWIHPHLCITTASRQLKDLVELEHRHAHATENVEWNAREDIDKVRELYLC